MAVPPARAPRTTAKARALVSIGARNGSRTWHGQACGPHSGKRRTA